MDGGSNPREVLAQVGVVQREAFLFLPTKATQQRGGLVKLGTRESSIVHAIASRDCEPQMLPRTSNTRQHSLAKWTL
eukprot:6082218-Alexandrium_andersonii.AAC.1